MRTHTICTYRPGRAHTHMAQITCMTDGFSPQHTHRHTHTPLPPPPPSPGHDVAQVLPPVFNGGGGIIHYINTVRAGVWKCMAVCVCAYVRLVVRLSLWVVVLVCSTC